jgi:hypothetical protein
MRTGTSRSGTEIRFGLGLVLPEPFGLKEEGLVELPEQLLDVVGGQKRPESADVRYLRFAHGSRTVELAQQKSDIRWDDHFPR